MRRVEILLPRLRREERGSTLLAVIGLMAVAAIAVAVVATSIVHSLAFTASSRAEVQSIAAAESGVNFARVQIAKGTDACAIDWSTATGGGTFTHVVEHSVDGTNWFGCPIGPTANYVRVAATGTADAKGIAGVTSGDQSTVAAVYDYTPGIGPILATGAAIYTEGNFGMDKGDLTVDPFQFSGGGGAIVRGDFNCKINSSEIRGSMWVYGNLNLGQCDITADAFVQGNATKENQGNVGGALCSTNLKQDCPPGWVMPPGPTWAEVGYTPASWVHADNLPFQIAPAPSSCMLQALVTSLPPGTRPILVDTRAACPNGVDIQGNTNFTRDVAIFAVKYNLTENGNNGGRLSSSAPQRVWLINPDADLTDGVPTCALPDGPDAGSLTRDEYALGDAGSNGVVTIANKVSAFLYTPCYFNIKNNSVWKGQIYTGGSDLKNNFDFTYSQIGIGGVNLNTGAVSGILPSYTLRSMRDLVGG